MTLSPSFQYISGHTTSGEIDRQQTGGLNVPNLIWNHPTFILGADFDYALTNRISFSAATEYSGGRGNSFWGGRGGISVSAIGPSLGFRFDVGIGWQSSVQTVGYTIEERRFYSDETHTYDFIERLRQPAKFFYGAWTISTTRKDSHVQFLLQFGWNRQFLFKLQPGISTMLTDEYTSMVSIFTLTPGIAIPLEEGVSMICGLRLSSPTTIDNLNRDFHLSPFFQMELDL
jgi:hypothetical protein